MQHSLLFCTGGMYVYGCVHGLDVGCETENAVCVCVCVLCVQVFSFGYCVWEALTATRPWAGEKAADIAAGVGRNGARLPLPASWSPRVTSLVRRCWSANPALRPTPAQVMTELDAEIRTALGNGR